MATPLFLRDPLWAGLIWKLGLTIFCVAVYLGIRDERRRHQWWLHVLSFFRLANPDEDNEDTMIMSRLIFRWSSVLMIILTLYHGWKLFDRAFHPFSEAVDADTLPDAQPGVGGGGNVGGGRFAPPEATDLPDADAGRLPQRPDPETVDELPTGGGGAVRLQGVPGRMGEQQPPTGEGDPY